MTTTQIIAALIGLYFLSAGIGLLVERSAIRHMLNELKSSPMLAYLGGVMAFAIGAAIVAVHNDWSSILAGIVSFIGWMCLVEGILLLAARRWFLSLFGSGWVSEGRATALGAATAVGGLILFMASFI